MWSPWPVSPAGLGSVEGASIRTQMWSCTCGMWHFLPLFFCLFLPELVISRCQHSKDSDSQELWTTHIPTLPAFQWVGWCLELCPFITNPE